MFSQHLAPDEVPRTRSRVRRNPPRSETALSQPQSRDGSVSSSAARQLRDDNIPARTRKTPRKEDDGSKEKEKKDESIVWVCAVDKDWLSRKYSGLTGFIDTKYEIRSVVATSSSRLPKKSRFVNLRLPT